MNNILDIAGIGIGPFNLSLALMLFEKTNLKFGFFDKKPEFCWHNGMALPNSKMQIHFLKDLVSLINPTSKFSFLNYLAENGLIYSFLNKGENITSREEFTKYMKWSCAFLNQLLHFNCEIQDIQFKNDLFEISILEEKFYAKNLVFGTGTKPNIPKPTIDLISDTLFHNSEFLEKISLQDIQNKEIVIIGGGQSGAEILEHLISQEKLPKKISIFSKRVNFSTLEDSPFANEFHHPSYVNLFYNFPKTSKQYLLTEQLLTSDGISESLLKSLYNKTYDLKFVRNKNIEITFCTKHNLVRVLKLDKNYKLEFEDLIYNTTTEIMCDIIILATGYRSSIPEFMEKLIPTSPEPKEDYSLTLEQFGKNKVFVQNFSRNSHGVSDPNLSLVSFRNAKIINSLLGEEIYKINHIKSLVHDK